MRNSLICSIVMFLIVIFGFQLNQAQAQEKLKGTISLSGAWALYPMVVKWGEEFQKLYPDVKVDIAAGGAGKGIADALAKVVDIGMVSREINPAEEKKGAWWVSVTKDAVVPTVNESNPLITELLAQGVDRESFKDLWITGKTTKWNDVIKCKGDYQVHVYTRSDACGAAETWAKYLGKNQEDLLGIGVYGDPGLAEAVRKDALGIGFNNINYVYDAKSKKQVKGIKILPIDLNDDGKINSDEAFYSTRDDIVNAIAAGKYPSPPARDLNFVSGGKPTNKLVVAFIKWVLTNGQEYVPESGYIKLSPEILNEQLNKLE